MPLELTPTALALLESENVQQQIILEIEGIDKIFASIKTLEFVKYGDPGVDYGDPGLVYGEQVASANSEDLVSLDKTTYEISTL